MKIKSTSIFNEDYKLKKAEKESSYFPQELQEILDGMGYEKPSKEYQGSYLFNKNDPDEMAIVNIVFKQRRDWVRDSEKSEYENLNPDRVGQDFFVQIIYTNTGSFGSNNPKKNITMKDILDGEYYMELEDDGPKFWHLIKLFEEGKRNVEREIAARVERERKRNMTPEQRQSASISDVEEYPMTPALLDWCKDHIKHIKIRVKESLIDTLKSRFPKSDYVIKEKFDVWSDKTYSWAAIITFDEVEDCPDDYIRDKAKDKNEFNSVSFAATLYDHGWDFGDNPNFKK